MTIKTYTRRSVASNAVITGLGVRSGLQITVTIEPAEVGHGIVISRRDAGLAWPADLAHIVALPACSSIGDEHCRVDFVEHLMAALWGTEVTDALISIDGPEVPLLDGSALPFFRAISEAGVTGLEGEVEALIPSEPIFSLGDDRALIVLPADSPRFSYSLVHPHSLIGHQFADFRAATDNFGEWAAPARTFATWPELSALQQAGLLKEGSDENCLIVFDDHMSAEPFAANAMARHKLLDMLGDLYLTGRPLCAHVIGYKTGHADNRALAAKILEVCE